MFLTFYTCKETLRRLDDYLDRELSERETVLVRRHLKICHRCSRRFALESRFIDEMRAKLRRVSAPPDLLQKVSEALRGADEGSGDLPRPGGGDP